MRRNRFDGQLTTTLHMDDGDAQLAADLLPILERKAGRILANGFPTGVEVTDTMVHGGPSPACLLAPAAPLRTGRVPLYAPRFCLPSAIPP